MWNCNLFTIYVTVSLDSSHTCTAQATAFQQTASLVAWIEYATNMALYSSYQFIEMYLDCPHNWCQRSAWNLCMHCYWLQWPAGVWLKIDGYDFAKWPLGTEAEVVVYADPLIRYKGDQGVLLIVTCGTDTLSEVKWALCATIWRQRGVKTD